MVEEATLRLQHTLPAKDGVRKPGIGEGTTRHTGHSGVTDLLLHVSPTIPIT